MAILGEVFSIIRNGASIKQIDGANGFPITRIETISNRVIDRNRLGYANVFDITEYESYVLQSGDILMSHINSEKHLGKTALYIKKGNEKIIHGMNLLMLRANSEVILPLYAKYFFDSNLFLKQIPNITKKSVNQASFTVTALKKLEIKIPQMVEQKRIIDIMSRLDNIIQYRKDQLEKLDLFVKSRFIEMFGEISVNSKHWKESRLEDLIIGKASNGFFAKPDKYSNDSKIGVICVGDVVNRKYSNINNLRRINMDEVSFKKYKVTYGDMLFCRSSLVKEGIAKASIVPKNSENAVFECHVIRIKLNTSIIVPEYMQAFSTTDYFRNQMIRMSKTATMTTIGQKDIISSSVLVPPIDIQNQFVDFMAQVDKSKLAIQQSLDELETLKKSLMQQYFG